MSALHSVLLYIHIGLGSMALLLYWLPVISKKGSRLHIRAGQVFYYFMLTVSASGMLMSLLGLFDPVGIYAAGKALTEAQLQRMLVWRIPFSQFLLLLSLLTWVTVRHAIGVLKARDDRTMLRKLSYQGPVWLMFPTATYVMFQGIQIGMSLLIIFSIVSLITAVNITRYAYKAQIAPRAWIIEHFSAMVGSGIAVYTAFFAAGGRRLLAQWLPGDWQLLTWLLAPSLGVLTLLFFTAYYKKKYRVTI